MNSEKDYIPLTPMVDPFQRSITYLRISLTDRCNLRCAYCMPAAGIKFVPRGGAPPGLTRVNVSLDPLRPDRFRRIPRHGDLAAVHEGIAAARAAGLAPI